MLTTGKHNWWLLLLPLLLAGGQLAPALELAGKAQALPIYLAADAAQEEQDAAAELARVFGCMGVATPEIRQVEDAKAIPAAAIVIGNLAADCGLEITAASPAQDGFRYQVAKQRLLILGETALGAYHGVSDLLETLGCGWYIPGPLGEVIPQLATVTVADDLDHAEASDSISRRFWYGGGGARHAKAATLQWSQHNKALKATGSWIHAWHGLLPPKTYFEDHPEYFSLNRGKRTTRQICTTNPEVIKIAAERLLQSMRKAKASGSSQFVFAAGPNDGGNLCECEQCATVDTPGYLEPSSNKPACSSRIFKFASDLAAITAKEFPNYYLGVLVYSDYSRIPLKLDKLHPNVFPMIAPIRRCRLHGPDNPLCEMNKLWGEEIRGWCDRSKNFGVYVYNYNLADTMLPLNKVSFYKRLGKVLGEQKNIEKLAWVFESIDSWATHTPHMYLSVRMAWQSQIDVDAEMQRFYAGLYGAAAKPMANYWTRIDDAYANTDTHTGSSYSQRNIWTPELIATLRQDIAQAQQLAQNDREKQVVAMAAAGFKCAEWFVAVQQAMSNCDFSSAKQLQDQLQAFITENAARKEVPNWFFKQYAWGYYQRFQGLTVNGGAKALENGGEVRVRFPDVWQFRTDATDQGVAAEWFKADTDAEAEPWQPMATWSKSWVDQGLTWYHGSAWYWTSFEMPRFDRADDLRLWFGGFDNNVEVWLNGVHLGEKKGFAKPAEFTDIAQHLQPGKTNVLAVRVAAGGLAEIGTGGLMQPVMIYKAGAAPIAPPEPDAKTAKTVEYEM